MKFGGAAIGTVAALTQALSIIMHEYARQETVLIIVSALDGVTDQLLQAAQLAQVDNQRGYRRIAATLRTRHLALVEKLPLEAPERDTLRADIDRLLFDMLNTCQQLGNNRGDENIMEKTDVIASAGERLAARILAAMLRQNNLRGVAVDGTDLILTNAAHGNALPDLEETCQRVKQHLIPMLSRQIIPVVTGYIGATIDGTTTTMGRGGSDYTASILSLCVEADEIWMWSDVDGMMSADPLSIEDARVIERLSYDEVAELAYFGAHILHPRMISPLRTHKIPLRIKNIYKPGEAGTLIQETAGYHTSSLKAITSIQGIGLSASQNSSPTDIMELVNGAFRRVTGTPPDVSLVSQSSAASFLCFIIPTTTDVEPIALQNAIEIALTEQHIRDWDVQPVQVVTVIGENPDRSPEHLARIFSSIHDLPLMGIAGGPTGCNFSLIFERARTAQQAVARIHPLILKSVSGSDPVPTS